MITVIILTLNEERDLADCLASVSWCGDVHVFDSGSTDRTVAIAQAAGARVTTRSFDNYASHRNAALALPEIRHDWILFLDADERLPAALAEEMLAAVQAATQEVGAFRLRRRDYFQGRWLRHAQLSPYFVRLLRRGRAQYERAVNETVRVDGPIVDLSEPFDHFPFSKGMAHWLDKHNRYSTAEATLATQSQRGETKFSLWRALVARDFNERRYHQKELFYRLPGRPFIKLGYMLFVRGAVLDGWPGIRFSLLQSFYEWMIVLKTAEGVKTETRKNVGAIQRIAGENYPSRASGSNQDCAAARGADGAAHRPYLGDSNHRTILGVRFFVGDAASAVRRGLAGGLVVVPAAPALVDLGKDSGYRAALQEADLVITDSGFLVLLWRLLAGERLPRTSGLRYLKLLLAEPEFRGDASTLWVMPNRAAADRCVQWLQANGISVSPDHCYLAPHYGAGLLEDSELLALVRRQQPRHIVVGLGGGTQERLGLYLKQNLDYRPGIHCIGAAIGFLTGDQARIPDWADRLFLGWLFRCLHQPGRFVPRYWRGRKLAWLLWKYRDVCPAP